MLLSSQHGACGVGRKPLHFLDQEGGGGRAADLSPVLEAVGQARRARMSESSREKAQGPDLVALEAVEAGATGIGAVLGAVLSSGFHTGLQTHHGAWTNWSWALSYSGRLAGQAGQCEGPGKSGGLRAGIVGVSECVAGPAQGLYHL